MSLSVGSFELRQWHKYIGSQRSCALSSGAIDLSQNVSPLRQCARPLTDSLRVCEPRARDKRRLAGRPSDFARRSQSRCSVGAADWLNSTSQKQEPLQFNPNSRLPPTSSRSRFQSAASDEQKFPSSESSSSSACLLKNLTTTFTGAQISISFARAKSSQRAGLYIVSILYCQRRPDKTRAGRHQQHLSVVNCGLGGARAQGHLPLGRPGQLVAGAVDIVVVKLGSISCSRHDEDQSMVSKVGTHTQSLPLDCADSSSPIAHARHIKRAHHHFLPRSGGDQSK